MQNLQVNCAESISLLSLLHLVPAQPKKNPAGSLSTSHGSTYTLPLEKERSLAGTLAFIPSIRDDPEHIPAVCVAEGPNSSYIEIILAINKIAFHDGSDILRDLKRGFEKIFRILATGFDGELDASSTENEVFTAIVSMCSSRILNRLGLMPGRKRSRKSVKDNLSKAIDCTKRLDYSRNPHTRSVVMSFETTAKEVIKLVNSWCNYQTPSRLEDLVEGIHQLHQQQTIHETLHLISNKDMDPSTRASLVNMISKVARYRQATKLLCHAARNFPIVRRAKVETVSLSQDAFQRFSFGEHEPPQLLSTILRLAPNMKVNSLSQIWHLLQTTEMEAINRFSQQLKNTLGQSKIHAEVQLIFHCELLQPAMKFPRVISSSKDACYLCNAFLSMHGRAHAPRCHGRLYPGWRLPFIPNLIGLQRRLNCYLETAIKDSLSTMLSRQKRIIFPFPQESTLLTLPTSSSTLERSGPNSPLATGSEIITSEDSHSSSVRTDAHRNQVHGQERDSVASRVDISITKDIMGSDHLSLKGSSDSDVLPIDLLCPGTSLTKRVKNISPLYAAGSLEVQIECDRRSRSVNAPSNSLLYTIEWLTVEDVNTFQGKCHSRCLIDVESLNDEATHMMCNENTLYIATHDSVMKLRFHSRAGCVENAE